MSLVNKVLRDLDARQASASDRNLLPPAVSPIPRAATGVRAYLLLAVVVVGLGLGAAIFFMAGEADRFASTPPAPVAAPPKVVAPVVAPPSATPDIPSAPKPAGVNFNLRLAEELMNIPSASRVASEPVAAAGVAAPATKAPRQNVAASASAEPRTAAKPVVALPRVVPALEALLKPEGKTQEAPVSLDTKIEKQSRSHGPGEQAEAEYRLAVLAQGEGKSEEALARYRMALAQQASHSRARLALANLLVEMKRYDEAEEMLQTGMEQGTRRLQFAQTLARLKVERGDAAAALRILQQQGAEGDGNADFQAFTGALLNRLGRPHEAVSHYQEAVRLEPNQARWWAGLGIALDADGKPAEARDAYLKARSLPGLPAELAVHVEARLK